MSDNQPPAAAPPKSQNANVAGYSRAISCEEMTNGGPLGLGTGASGPALIPASFYASRESGRTGQSASNQAIENNAAVE